MHIDGLFGRLLGGYEGWFGVALRAQRHKGVQMAAWRPKKRHKIPISLIDEEHSEVLATSEERAAADGKEINDSLHCALQEHVIRANRNERWPNNKHVNDLSYHLAFVEFKENGEPFALKDRVDDGRYQFKMRSPLSLWPRDEGVARPSG